MVLVSIRYSNCQVYGTRWNKTEIPKHFYINFEANASEFIEKQEEMCFLGTTSLRGNMNLMPLKVNLSLVINEYTVWS